MPLLDNALRLSRARRLLEKATIALEKNSDSSSLINPHFTSLTEKPSSNMTNETNEIKEVTKPVTKVTKPTKAKKSNIKSPSFKDEKINLIKSAGGIKKTEDIDTIRPYNKSLKKVDFSTALKNNKLIVDTKFIPEEELEEQNIIEATEQETVYDEESKEKAVNMLNTTEFESDTPINAEYNLDSLDANVDILDGMDDTDVEELEEISTDEPEEVVNEISIIDIKKSYLKSFSTTDFKNTLSAFDLNMNNLDELISETLFKLVNLTRKELNLSKITTLYDENIDMTSFSKDILVYRKIPSVTLKNVVVDYLFNLQTNEMFLQKIGKSKFKPISRVESSVKSRNISMNFNHIGFTNLVEYSYSFKAEFSQLKQLPVRTNSYLISLPSAAMLEEVMILLQNVPNQIVVGQNSTSVLINTPDNFAIENKLNGSLKSIISKGATISLINIDEDIQLNILRKVENRDFIIIQNSYGESNYQGNVIQSTPQVNEELIELEDVNSSIEDLPELEDVSSSIEELPELQEENTQTDVKFIEEDIPETPEIEETIDSINLEKEDVVPEVEESSEEKNEYEFNDLNEVEKYQIYKFISKNILDVDFRTLDSDISKNEFNDYMKSAIIDFLNEYSKTVTINVIKTTKFRANRIEDPLNGFVENLKRINIDFRDLEYMNDFDSFAIVNSLEFSDIKNELLDLDFSQDALNMNLVLLCYNIKIVQDSEFNRVEEDSESYEVPTPIVQDESEEFTNNENNENNDKNVEDPFPFLEDENNEKSDVKQTDEEIDYGLDESDQGVKDERLEDEELLGTSEDPLSFDDSKENEPMFADDVDDAVQSGNMNMSGLVIDEPLNDEPIKDESSNEYESEDEIEIEDEEEYNGKEPMSKFKKIMIGTVAGLVLLGAAGGGYLFLTGGNNSNTTPQSSQQSTTSNNSSSTNMSKESVGENAFSGGSSIQLETNTKLESNDVKKLDNSQKTFLGITEDTINITVGDQNQDLKIDGYVVDSDKVNWVKLTSQKDNKSYFVKFVQ